MHALLGDEKRKETSLTLCCWKWEPSSLSFSLSGFNHEMVIGQNVHYIISYSPHLYLPGRVGSLGMSEIVGSRLGSAPPFERDLGTGRNQIKLSGSTRV